MKEYTVDNIDRLGVVPDKVQANSPLKAVRKLYPTAKRVKNGGNIVVYCRYETPRGTIRSGSYVYEVDNG